MEKNRKILATSAKLTVGQEFSQTNTAVKGKKAKERRNRIKIKILDSF